MNITAERVERGLRPATPVDSPLVFLSDRWFVHPANNILAPFGQHGQRERGKEQKRKEKGREQGGPGGDAMMRSRHMLRPLGDSPYTRLLINSQAFVLADNTGEITSRTLAFRRQLRDQLLDTLAELRDT